MTPSPLRPRFQQSSCNKSATGYLNDCPCALRSIVNAAELCYCGSDCLLHILFLCDISSYREALSWRSNQLNDPHQKSLTLRACLCAVCFNSCLPLGHSGFVYDVKDNYTSRALLRECDCDGISETPSTASDKGNARSKWPGSLETHLSKDI
jgi:hypothetical protein